MEIEETDRGKWATGDACDYVGMADEFIGDLPKIEGADRARVMWADGFPTNDAYGVLTLWSEGAVIYHGLILHEGDEFVPEKVR